MNQAAEINSERLWASLEQVSRVEGTVDGGLHRLASSREDGQATDWCVTQLKDIGTTVRIDSVDADGVTLRDALVSAARMITEVEKIGLGRPAEGRATVGVLHMVDAAPNVVPDRVRFTVELRHPSRVDEMAAEVVDAVHRIAQMRGCTTRYR